MRFVLYRVEKREDQQGEDQKYDSAKKQVERRGRERREFLRSLCAVGAINFSSVLGKQNR